jgi:drug/metabolite transporter (DMT)-like permease
MSPQRKGLWLGFIGVLLFAATVPATKLATGSVNAPHLSPGFVTFGRAAVAGVLSILYLLAVRAPRPSRATWPGLGAVVIGVVFGFPLFLALGVKSVAATHAAIVTGLLPLGTAIVGALWHRQKAPLGFWVAAASGCVLVLVYAALTGSEGAARISVGDLWLLLAVAAGSLGYVAGGDLARRVSAQQVICWALVAALPITLPLTLLAAPETLSIVTWQAWGGFMYVALFSMWIGFFAWYRGLALGGTMRVSQVQLLQPFLSVLIAVPLLGETLSLVSLAFCAAIVATIAIGRRFAPPPAATAKAHASLLALVGGVLLAVTGSQARAETAPSPFAARQASLAVQLQEMKKLDPFLGEWLGEGKIETPGGGATQTIVQMVRVEAQMAGQLITMVDRVQRRVEPMVSPTASGFAAISYDDKAKRFLFRSYFMDGFTDLETEVPEAGLLRGLTREGAAWRRLTVDTRERGVWKEHAEASRDGGRTWTTAYDITMKRVAGTGKGE